MNQAFDKDDIGDLADFFPFLFRGEDGLVGTPDEFAGIVAVENGDAGAIDELVVRSVVDKDDTARGEDRRRAGLDNARIKFSRPAREDRSFCCFGPVIHIVGVGKPHLVSLVRSGAEPVHPILAVDLFGHDSAGLRPTFVPVSLVGGKDHPLALPMDQVARRGEAKLGVFFVVAGVGEVVDVAEFLQARIFDTAVFFVVRLGRENRLRSTREVNPIGTLGIAKMRSTCSVLRAVEHNEFANILFLGILSSKERDRRIESAGGFPCRTLRRKNGLIGCPLPGQEGKIRCRRCESEGASEQQQHHENLGLYMHDQRLLTLRSC